MIRTDLRKACEKCAESDIIVEEVPRSFDEMLLGNFGPFITCSHIRVCKHIDESDELLFGSDEELDR